MKQPVYRVTRWAMGTFWVTCEVMDEETRQKFIVQANSLICDCEAKKVIVRDMVAIWYAHKETGLMVYPGSYLPVTAVERTEDGWKVKRVGWKGTDNPGNSNYIYMTNDEIRTYLEDGNIYVFDNLKLSADHKVIQGKPEPGISIKTTGEAKLTEWGCSHETVDTKLLYHHKLYKPKAELLYNGTPKAFGPEIDAFLDNELAFAERHRFASRYLGVQRYLGSDNKVHTGPVLLCAWLEHSYIKYASYLVVNYTGNSIELIGTAAEGKGYRREIALDEIKKNLSEIARHYMFYRADQSYNITQGAMYDDVENSDLRELIYLSSKEQNLIDDYNEGDSEEREDAYYTLERLSALRRMLGGSGREAIEVARYRRRKAGEKLTEIEKKEVELILKPFRPNLEQMKALEAQIENKYEYNDGVAILEDVIMYNCKQPNSISQFFTKADLAE